MNNCYGLRMRWKGRKYPKLYKIGPVGSYSWVDTGLLGMSGTTYIYKKSVIRAGSIRLHLFYIQHSIDKSEIHFKYYHIRLGSTKVIQGHPRELVTAGGHLCHSGHIPNLFRIFLDPFSNQTAQYPRWRDVQYSPWAPTGIAQQSQERACS